MVVVPKLIETPVKEKEEENNQKVVNPTIQYDSDEEDYPKPQLDDDSDDMMVLVPTKLDD